MEGLADLVLFVQNIGIPGFLVVGGGWWFAQRGFPELVRLAEAYAAALMAVSGALHAVAEKMPDPLMEYHVKQ